MKIRTNALAGIALAATAALGLAACGSGSSSPAGSSAAANGSSAGEITVYNAQHESLTKEWIDAFTAETGIKVTVRQGDDTEMSNQIVQEGQASPADVFLTENSPAMTQVENAGLFADVDKATVDQVPAEFRPSTGKWTGIAARSTVLVYDKNKISARQAAEVHAGPGQPRVEGPLGRLAVGRRLPGDRLGAAGAQGRGRHGGVAEGHEGRTAKVYKGNSTAMKAVNAGEVDAALIYHYYYYGDQAKTGENSNNVGRTTSRTRTRAPSSPSPAAAC